MQNDKSCAADSSCPYMSFLCGKGTYLISVAVLALLVFNCLLISWNRSTQNTLGHMQQQLSEKATKLQQDQVLNNVYQGIVQALAVASVTRHDDQIKNLLAQNGIKVQPKNPQNVPAPAPAMPAPPPPATP